MFFIATHLRRGTFLLTNTRKSAIINLYFSEQGGVLLKLEKIDRAEAFRYMGHKGGVLPESMTTLADECEQCLLTSITPKLVYAVFDIEHTEKGIAVCGTPLILKGNDISAHLRDCEKCVLFAATLGTGADAVIRSYESAAMEKAVIADCMASAAIEQVCDRAEAEIREKLPEMHFTWRFSPGYGDFPINVQRDFLNVLSAQKRIGLTVTDDMILIPRKSVTAVIGVSEREIPKGRRGCAVCGMKDKCELRKQGTHCK